MKIKPWLMYAIFTTIAWGVWGAVMEFPAKWGNFPETLGYVTWSLTMIPCAIYALKVIDWKFEKDPRSILLGCIVGLTGAGGQLLLFMALRQGPAYVIFPIISLYPVLTILLSVSLLKEKAKTISWIGIALALVAIYCLAYQPPSEMQTESSLWLVLASLVFVLWGVQAYVMKFANNTMKAESIFFYMMVTGLALSPVAIMMTDFSKEINWGWQGPYLSFSIQSLNAIGALFIVYALRFGRAIVVVPMTSLAPVITIVLSLLIYGVVPNAVVLTGLGIASISIYLLSIE
jgi:drug/metabolite transporter (DMT)-like permease